MANGERLRESVARALIVHACCKECEPDWESWLPEADAVLDALGLEQVGWVSESGLFYGDYQREQFPAVPLRPVYRIEAAEFASSDRVEG